jgi:hypothetical protein
MMISNGRSGCGYPASEGSGSCDRQHPQQRPIPKNEMMDERRGRVKADQRQHAVGEHFVNFLDIMRKSAVGRPWRSDFEQAKDR